MTLAVRLVAALVVGVGATAVLYAATAAAADRQVVLGPDPVTVVVDIDHSSFQPPRLRVVRGTEVRFVVNNHDPINHELIVGPPEVHARHRNGTEPHHPAVPGEVSVPPLERRVTSYTFTSPGVVEMACHLPGHYDYGMRGSIEVVRE
jgi:uncharacterized cupredoxin-like copper-binding protein